MSKRTDEIEALRARVAELESAISMLLEHRFGELPYQGWLRDNDQSRKALANLAAVVRGKDATT